MTGEEIAAAAQAGEEAARTTLQHHASRLARGLAHVVNIFDPEVIVLGGGLSRLDHLYRDLPPLVARHVFAERANVVIRPPRWGDASGVRGAAWLWGRP
jgi:fructokinase